MDNQIADPTQFDWHAYIENPTKSEFSSVQIVDILDEQTALVSFACPTGEDGNLLSGQFHFNFLEGDITQLTSQIAPIV